MRSIGAPGLAIFLFWLDPVDELSTPGDPAPIAVSAVVESAGSWVAAGSGCSCCAGIWPIGALHGSVRCAITLGIVAFIALNAAALRAVHFLAGVPGPRFARCESLLVQAVLSLLWTCTAMGLMVFAHRRTMRGLVALGAALLAAVVVKLFFVDLSAQGTIERIVSFVGVGVLILVIGYLAPVPPTATRAQGAAA